MYLRTDTIDADNIECMNAYQHDQQQIQGDIETIQTLCKVQFIHKKKIVNERATLRGDLECKETKDIIILYVLCSE